jgi:hypothetical protein
VDLREASASETIDRLHLVMGELAEVKPRGVILDDINEIEEPTVRISLARFLSALRRRDALCLFTHYRTPTSRTCSDLNVDIAAHIVIPHLTEHEVGELIVAAGGDAQRWTTAIRMIGASGHPQLVLAAIAGMRARSWPVEELENVQALDLSAFDDIEVERRAARQRLITVLPEVARTLLYRLSLVIGRFDRKVALAVGSVVPSVRHTGEQLDQLIGPWIDQSSGSEFRISPLMLNAGDDMLEAVEKKAVHRAISVSMMGGKSVHISWANAAFYHGLIGQAEEPLMKIAYSVITASPESREKLVGWLVGLRCQRVDRPIFTSNMVISRMLRLAQFLLRAETGDIDSIRECWNALYTEVLQEPDTVEREMFEAMILSELLVGRSSAGMIPNWLALLIRLEELIGKHVEFQQIVRKLEQPQENIPPMAVASFLFINQALGTRSVEELASLFDKLDQLPPEQRQRLFLEVERTMPSDFSLIVSNAWLEDHKRGEIDWLKAAERYAGMAKKAVAWGFRMLAIRCFVARAVMLDEYAENPQSALNILDEAVREFGHDLVIARARAKILYRRKDHAAALLLLRQVAEKVAVGDAVERAFLLRETGISAAEIGEWKEAVDWLTAARQAAATAGSPEMRAMAIGLRADAAVAAFKSGDAITALRELALTLEELDTLNPSSSIKAAYCHRVVRHTVLWLFGEGTGTEVEVHGELAAMVPGACSNPEPSEDIKKIPLGPLSIVWYLLAQTELVIGVDAGVNAELPSRLQHETIPLMEVALRNRRIQAAIYRSDVGAVVIALGPWVDANLYFSEHKAEWHSQNILQPEYGIVPIASSEQLQTPKAIFTSAETLLAFGIYSVCSGKCMDWILLSNEIERIYGSDYPGRAILAALGGDGAQGEGVEYELASLVHIIEQRADVDPNTLFIAGVRFVEAAARSNFKELLADTVGNWVKISWTKAVQTQQFLLVNPKSTVPILKEAILTNDGLAGAARILLAAEGAIKSRIDASFRDFLRSLT